MNFRKARKEMIKLEKYCHSFSRSFDGVYFKCDYIGGYGNYMFRLCISIHHSHGHILSFMSALFGFAQFHKLILTNQTFYPEKVEINSDQFVSTDIT